MIYKGLSFVLWFFIWILLSWPPTARYLITGIFVSLFVTFMTVDTFRSPRAEPGEGVRPQGPLVLVKKILWFVCYAAVFLWECIKANADVAWRVVCPGLPIRPATIRVRTLLKSDIGLTFLANSITLTPGTTTIDIDKENGYIYVHILSLKEGYPAGDMRLPIVSKFERILKRIFE